MGFDNNLDVTKTNTRQKSVSCYALPEIPGLQYTSLFLHQERECPADLDSQVTNIAGAK